MPTYLERYIAGEREAVWDELLALGAAIREQPLYTDALAVARETMTRARYNVELLVARLRASSYKFSSKEPHKLPPSDIDKQIAKLEERTGVIPLSIRMWYEIVGEVNLSDKHNKTFQVKGISDQPHVLRFRTEVALRISTDAPVPEIRQAFADFTEGNVALTDPIFVLRIADDKTHGTIGDTISVPNAAIDGNIGAENLHETFAQYLRRSFRWGGFLASQI